MKIRASNTPYWREYLPLTYHFDQHAGRVVRDGEGGCRHPDPNRPMVWHEIVRDGQVVMRSLKPVEKLIPLVGTGEQLYRVRRRDRQASVTRVVRKLVKVPKARAA